MYYRLSLCGLLTVLAMPAISQADDRPRPQPLTVNFKDCTEFVGVAAVDEAKARALVPERYQLVVDQAGAKLVVRIANCQGIAVNSTNYQPGTVAHIGIMLYSPDGTATDPNNSINNYTLSYTSNLKNLVNALNKQDIPAKLDDNLSYEVNPVNASNELYTNINPQAKNPVAWSLHGTVNTPQFPSDFLANWWFLSRKAELKMATDIPVIYFDFNSTVSFFTSRNNPIGQLLGSNSIANFPLSFRGQFASGQMQVSQNR